jgi:hypothetical protein
MRFVVGRMNSLSQGLSGEQPFINAWVDGYDITTVPWGGIVVGEFDSIGSLKPNPDTVTTYSISSLAYSGGPIEGSAGGTVYPLNCDNPVGYGYDSDSSGPGGPFNAFFANTGRSQSALGNGWVVVKSQIQMPPGCPFYLFLLKNGAAIAACVGVIDSTGILNLPVPPKENPVSGADVYALLPVLTLSAAGGLGLGIPASNCCAPSSTAVPFYACGLAS